MRCACIAKDCGGANASCWTQIPPDLVVKSQPTDIVAIVLQLIRRPNGAHRACHSRKSRCEPFSTSEVQWSTTKSDGVCRILPQLRHQMQTDLSDHVQGIVMPQ